MHYELSTFVHFVASQAPNVYCTLLRYPFQASS